MRVLIDIPDEQLRKLAELRKCKKRPRTALIREAIAEYVTRHPPDAETDAGGLWGARGADGVA